MQIKKESNEKTEKIQPLLLTSEQAAKALNVTVRTLYDLRKKGAMPPVMLPLISQPKPPSVPSRTILSPSPMPPPMPPVNPLMMLMTQK